MFTATMGVLVNAFGTVITAIFYAIAYLLSWLVQASMGLFGYIVNPAFTYAILNNSAIYSGWMAIKDMLNLFFIPVLLFSAFATIFQASAYHLKNTFLWVILMALLVN